MSELTSIELDDISLEEGIIKIHKAKGSKERYVTVANDGRCQRRTNHPTLL